ncbi:short-chain dehydrogenase [bacterium 336/3]|nr:short-chain dehydrogenase [bacterium 336/3]
MKMLENKIIVVTGGNGLLGQEFIKDIRQEGGIAINIDIYYKQQTDFICDISDKKSVEGTVNEIINQYGKIDGWINNAYPRTSDWGVKFEDIPVESWQKNIDMHLNGYFICCQVILEVMKKQNNGAVINMGSIYGFLGPDFSVYQGTNMTMPAGYAAIKGGITNLTRYLASYYGKYNIRVNSISPGGIWDNQNEIFVNRYIEKIPLKRMAKPIDISPTASFLLSDKASYITGHNLVIDGGWSII